MVELALHDSLETPYVESLDGDTTRVHLGLNHNSDDLKYHLAAELDEHQLDKALNLLSNDNQARDFIRSANYIIVREV